MKQLVSFLALAAATAAAASAQTLPWSITTESTRTTPMPGVSSTHTEHARPAALRPLLSTTSSSTASSTTLIEYSIQATNPGTTTDTFTPSMFRSESYVTNTTCWGVDPTTPSPFPVPASYTLAPGATASYTGTQTLTFSTPIGFFSCSGMSDTLHVSSGGSFVLAGPMNQGGWIGGFNTPVNVTDTGTTFTSEVVITTNYDLPLVAGPSGCTPLQANSTGAMGALEAYGVADAADGLVVLSATDLPANEFALFVAAAQTTAPTPISFGQATLCLDAPLFRWNAAVGTTDANGTFTAELRPADVQVPGVAIMAGSTWAFQLLHRDGASANSTNSVSIAF